MMDQAGISKTFKTAIAHKYDLGVMICLLSKDLEIHDANKLQYVPLFHQTCVIANYIFLPWQGK